MVPRTEFRASTAARPSGATVRGILWVAAGGAAAAGLFLATRRVSVPIMPSRSYGETQKVLLSVPAGWRRVTSAEVSALPELASQASLLRATPGFTSMRYGTLTPFTASNGNTYATWVEQHYHEPGGPAKPWGLHHGVTLLTRTTTGMLLDEWWQ